MFLAKSACVYYIPSCAHELIPPMRDLSTIFEPVYFREQIREIEAAASGSLMERAGASVAEFARELIPGRRVLVLAGPGNNGGDAFVAARHLKSWWFEVTLVFSGDPERQPVEAAKTRLAWLESGGDCLSEIPAGGKWDLAIDGLFGTGLTRPLSSAYLNMVGALNALDLPVIAIDIPSGIDADTGSLFGAAVVATHTLTFIAFKPGLLTSSGLDYSGQVRLDPLGVYPGSSMRAQGWRVNAKILDASFKRRPRNSHKGSFGITAVIGGSRGMLGAALLAGRAALKLGSGKVILGTGDLAVDPVQPEIMIRDPLGGITDGASCIVIGPGLGKSEAARTQVHLALCSDIPLIIDADALNLISNDPELQLCLTSRSAAGILTPHPLEAARLSGCATSAIQNDRVNAAKHLAEKFGCFVVLKGAGSICAFPDGTWVINTSGNPGMATAGMGDVLSGMIGAFLSQGLEPERALLCAVYLHGAAADSMAECGKGPIGMSASEVIDEARVLLNRALAK